MGASPVYLKQFEIGPMQNFAYLLGDPERRECFVVDPAWDAEGIFNRAASDRMKITGVILTHAHYDHANVAAEILRKIGGKIYVNEEEVRFLEKFAANSGGIFCNVASMDTVAVRDNEKIKIGGVEVRCLHTPGHTPGSQCLLAGKNLITGDTLFVDYCGRCDLFGGDPAKMHESLSRKLAKLEEDVVLYPGHHYSDRPTSTLGEEKKTNPYLKALTFQEFTRALRGLLD